jgi:hypothetical protein
VGAIGEPDRRESIVEVGDSEGFVNFFNVFEIEQTRRRLATSLSFRKCRVFDHLPADPGWTADAGAAEPAGLPVGEA